MARMTYQNNVALGRYDDGANKFTIQKMTQGDMDVFRPKIMVRVDINVNKYFHRYIHSVNGCEVKFLDVVIN